MKYKTLKEIEERRAQIKEELEKDGADLNALKAEVEELRKYEEDLKKAAKEAEETRRMIADGLKGTVVESHTVTEAPKDDEEVRKSKAYIDAFAEYIKTGDDKECRKLLSTNATAATGYVPVPVMVEGIIKTAWERLEFLGRVKKTGFKGNLKVPFELTADGAYEHSEGTTAVTEENLTIGIVELKPENIKKWIRISDEAVAMGGEAFVRYIYEEIAYRVLKKLTEVAVGKIVSAGTSNSSSAIGIPKVSEAPGINTIRNATANLSDEAVNLCVVINRLTEAEFNDAHAAGNFAIDPWAGLPRVYTTALPAYTSADENATYAIIGDLSALQVNYPEGEGIIIKWDDMSLAEEDLVKVVGRQYAGCAVTGPGRLVRLTKPASAVTT